MISENRWAPTRKLTLNTHTWWDKWVQLLLFYAWGLSLSHLQVPEVMDWRILLYLMFPYCIQWWEAMWKVLFVTLASHKEVKEHLWDVQIQELKTENGSTFLAFVTSSSSNCLVLGAAISSKFPNSAFLRLYWTGTRPSAFMFFACVLSHFSRVRLCAIPWTVARQAPLSMGFFSQEYWNGLPCPPPGDLPDPGLNPCLLHLLGVLYH